jgi:hypothetical protein
MRSKKPLFLVIRMWSLSSPFHASLTDRRTINDLVLAVLLDVGALYKASEAVRSLFLNQAVT